MTRKKKKSVWTGNVLSNGSVCYSNSWILAGLEPYTPKKIRELLEKANENIPAVNKWSLRSDAMAHMYLAFMTRRDTKPFFAFEDVLPFFYIEPDELFVVLSKEGLYYKVITSLGQIGWLSDAHENHLIERTTSKE